MRATQVEARELPRHADVRMTTKYTHFGLQDQAEALAGPPNPNAYTTADELGIGWVSSGALGQELAAAVGEADPDAGLRNEQTPDCSGGCVVFCRKLSAAGNLHRSGGGGNCTRVPRRIGEGIYVRSRSFDCRPRRPERQGRLRLSPS